MGRGISLLLPHSEHNIEDATKLCLGEQLNQIIIKGAVEFVFGFPDLSPQDWHQLQELLFRCYANCSNIKANMQIKDCKMIESRYRIRLC